MIVFKWKTRESESQGKGVHKERQEMNIVIKKGERGEDRSISHDDDVAHKGLGDNCSATRSVSARCATASSATSVHSGAASASCWAAGRVWKLVRAAPD